MSRLNSLSKGYEEGSERTDVPLPTPQKRNHVSEVLTPTEEYYIENNITDNDILFIIENIKCLEGGTNYKGDVTHNPLTGRICNFIKINYEAEKLSLNNLNEITRGLNEILLTITQNKKVIKDTPKVEEIKGPINLKTLRGYQEGSERISIPLPTPQKRNHVLEILTPTREYYTRDNITKDDILFIIESVKCLEHSTHPEEGVTCPPLTGRICNFIKINYEAEKLSLNNLNEITRGLNEILFTPTQNGKIIKDTPKVEEIKGPINLKTLSRYQEGSLRIKSDNPPKPYEGAPPKQIDPTYIVDSLKTFQSGGNLTEDAIKKIIAELNKLI